MSTTATSFPWCLCVSQFQRNEPCLSSSNLYCFKINCSLVYACVHAYGCVHVRTHLCMCKGMNVEIRGQF